MRTFPTSTNKGFAVVSPAEGNVYVPNVRRQRHGYEDRGAGTVAHSLRLQTKDRLSPRAASLLYAAAFSRAPG